MQRDEKVFFVEFCLYFLLLISKTFQLFCRGTENLVYESMKSIKAKLFRKT